MQKEKTKPKRIQKSNCAFLRIHRKKGLDICLVLFFCLPMKHRTSFLEFNFMDALAVSKIVEQNTFIKVLINGRQRWHS